MNRRSEEEEKTFESLKTPLEVKPEICAEAEEREREGARKG
jgi:hypothetical protein